MKNDWQSQNVKISEHQSFLTSKNFSERKKQIVFCKIENGINYSLAMLYAMRNGTLRNSERKFESKDILCHGRTQYIYLPHPLSIEVFHQSKRVNQKMRSSRNN